MCDNKWVKLTEVAKRPPPLLSISASAFLKGVGVLGVISNSERRVLGVLISAFSLEKKYSKITYIA